MITTTTAIAALPLRYVEITNKWFGQIRTNSGAQPQSASKPLCENE